MPQSLFPSSGVGDPDDYEYLIHIYSQNQPETYNVVYDWRDVLDTYITSQGEYKIMMTEAYADLQLMIKYYGTQTRNGSIPFNFSFLGEINKYSTAWDIKTVIDKWMTYMPSGRVANWVVSLTDTNKVWLFHITLSVMSYGSHVTVKYGGLASALCLRV